MKTIRLLTHSEIAKNLGIPLEAVTVHYNEAYKKIYDYYRGKDFVAQIYTNGDAVLANNICFEKHEWTEVM